MKASLEKKREAIFEEERRWRNVDDEDLKSFRLDLINAVWLLPTKRLKELLKINEKIVEQYEKEIEIYRRLGERILDRRASFYEMISYDGHAEHRLKNEQWKAENAIHIISRLIALSE